MSGDHSSAAAHHWHRGRDLGTALTWEILSTACWAGYFEAALGQKFNLAAGKETRIADLARMNNEQVGNKAGIAFTERRKWDTKSRLLASVDRAKSLIGYQPNTPFEMGLREAIASFQVNWERLSAAARFALGVSSAVRQMVTPGKV